MVQHAPVPLCFKGVRTYLHGTDLYTAICAHVPGLTGQPLLAPLRIVIHRQVHHACELVLGGVDEAVDRPPLPWAEFSCSAPGGARMGWLYETDRVVDCRTAYDEGRIDRSSVLNREKQWISITEDPGFTPIEVIVTLTKVLHTALVPAPGKWLFTRLDLGRLLRSDDAGSVRIELVHNFQNRLTKSRIVAPDGLIGHIFFSAAVSA